MSEHVSIQDSVAIVTGGGQGLGKTLTHRLLSLGMKVAICGRTQATLDNTVAEFSKLFPGQILARRCDVSQAAQVSAFIDTVTKQWGTADVLINNSGFGKQSLIWETSEADWDEVMDTNVKGTYLMCKAVVPGMIERKQGYIINIASQAALNGYANAGVYCASKFAMVGLSKALQEEVRQYGIHVHSLNPALSSRKKQRRSRLTRA